MSLGQFVTTGEPVRLEGEGLVLREWTEAISTSWCNSSTN